MPFTVGDLVHVSALGKGTVREVRSGGRYLIDIKGRSLVVGESQLSAVAGRPPSAPPHATTPTDPPDLARRGISTSLDLHGMTTDEAAVALDTFISDAILAGHLEVRVIHGRSGGRLKALVHTRLRALPSVRGFRLDPRNPGVTIVTF